MLLRLALQKAPAALFRMRNIFCQLLPYPLLRPAIPQE
jgi:hypothetical protein